MPKDKDRKSSQRGQGAGMRQDRGSASRQSDRSTDRSSDRDRK